MSQGRVALGRTGKLERGFLSDMSSCVQDQCTQIAIGRIQNSFNLWIKFDGLQEERCLFLSEKERSPS